jgi:prepilin peptidase CpaA
LQNLLFHSAFFNAPVFLTLALIAVLCAAALYDIKTFTIPHIFAYLLVALFLVNTLSTGLSFSALPWHFLSVIIAFGIGLALFAFRIMGGGDVKLFTALALWFLPLGLIGLMFCITTTGLAISLGTVIFKMSAMTSDKNRSPTVIERYKTMRKVRIPYGPAIALGTILYLILSRNLGCG